MLVSWLSWFYVIFVSRPTHIIILLSSDKIFICPSVFFIVFKLKNNEKFQLGKCDSYTHMLQMNPPIDLYIGINQRLNQLVVVCFRFIYTSSACVMSSEWFIQRGSYEMFITSFFLNVMHVFLKLFYLLKHFSSWSNTYHWACSNVDLNRPLAANESSKQKAIVSFYRDDSDTVLFWSFLRSASNNEDSEGILFDWLNGWKCWTVASKNVWVEESNTRLEKWRATWNAYNGKTDKK